MTRETRVIVVMGFATLIGIVTFGLQVGRVIPLICADCIAVTCCGCNVGAWLGLWAAEERD